MSETEHNSDSNENAARFLRNVAGDDALPLTLRRLGPSGPRVDPRSWILLRATFEEGVEAASRHLAAVLGRKGELKGGMTWAERLRPAMREAIAKKVVESH